MGAHADFYAYFKALTTTPMIMANQNGPRPALPYITLQVDLGNPLPVHIGKIADGGSRALNSHRNARIQLQCFGPDSWEIMEALSMAIHTEAANVLANEKNIAINEQPQLQDIPVLRNATTYEARAVLDIDASYTRAASEIVDYFDKVHGTSDVTPQVVTQEPQSFVAEVVADTP
jgi:hypothetical protein